MVRSWLASTHPVVKVTSALGTAVSLVITATDDQLEVIFEVGLVERIFVE